MKTLTRWMLVTVLGFAAAVRAQAAEIPANLDAMLSDSKAAAALERAGLSPQDAGSLAASLDKAELAQLAQTDATQQGGDALVTIAIVIAVLAVVYMWLRHDEVMSGH